LLKKATRLKRIIVLVERANVFEFDSKEWTTEVNVVVFASGESGGEKASKKVPGQSSTTCMGLIIARLVPGNLLTR